MRAPLRRQHSGYGDAVDELTSTEATVYVFVYPISTHLAVILL